MKMRVNLIHNPVAGSDDQPDADKLKRLIERAGHQVIYQSARGIDWTTAFDVPSDFVVVAGGDGTAGRIAKKLVGRDIPLTFIPMGTANNISKTFGLADLPLEDLIDSWRQARSQWIDVGIIDSPWGSQYFIEGVGAGLFVRTMIEIDSLDALGHLESSEQKITHALRILGERLESFPARQLNLTLDDKELSGEYIMLEVMNIRFIGPNLYIAPASDPTDGLLDVVLVTERERSHLREYMTSWRQGVLTPPDLPTYQGRHLHIEEQGDVLHVDDEAWPPADVCNQAVSVPIDIRSKQRALELLVPTSN